MGSGVSVPVHRLWYTGLGIPEYGLGDIGFGLSAWGYRLGDMGLGILTWEHGLENTGLQVVERSSNGNTYLG